MDATEPDPFVSSKGVGSLLGLVEKLADEWLVGAVSCTDLEALFSAVTGIVSKSLLEAARKWNLTHDRMRRLPPELRDQCMLFLPTVDKCQLGAVCSFWRDTIYTRQSLWSDVDVMHHHDALPAILPRSGESPLHVALTLPSRLNWSNANKVLRPHAHRLRRLHIRFDDITRYGFSAPLAILDYPVPLLCAVTLERVCRISGSLLYSLPHDFCTGVAPALRSITLRHVTLPPTCPALSNVSCAWIEGYQIRGIEHIFIILPSLRKLSLVDLPSQTPLPAIPRSHPIAEIDFSHFKPPIIQLQDGGYLRLRRLRVVNGDGLRQLGAALRALSTSSHSSLTIGASGAAELILRRDGGREASFVADALFIPEIRDALHDGLFRDVEHLVLPLYPDDMSTGKCALFPGDIDLPRLLSLRISCGRPSSCSLLDPALERGTIFAPLLTRLEINADADSQPVQIRPWHLGHFIETTLDLGAGAPLDVFIDSAHGVQLEGESDLEDRIAHLRSCVGALHL